MQGKLKYLREFRGGNTDTMKWGDRFDVRLFKTGDLVDVTGI